jgi:hypothetical protein
VVNCEYAVQTPLAIRSLMPDAGDLLPEIRPLGKRTIDGVVDRRADRVRLRDLAEGLDVELRGWPCADGHRKIPLRNLLGSQSGLPLVVRVGGGAAGLEHVGQCRQSVLQTIVGRALHGLRVGQTCAGGIFLSRCVQQAIVGVRYLENDPAVGVVEREVRRERLGPRDVDAPGSPAESKTM